MADAGGMSDYLDIFLEEADEQVDTLDQGILRLEREPQNEELLQAIFRSAHSLKGAAATMGFVSMSKLTHAAENLLDRFRTGEMRPDTAAIDLLLAAVDALKRMKESVRAGGVDDLDVAHIATALSDLGQRTENERGLDQAGTQADQFHFDAAGGDPPLGNTFRVVVELAPDCELPSVRAMLVLGALDGVGRVLELLHPSRDAVPAEGSEKHLEALVEAATAEAIRAALESVAEIASFHISEHDSLAGEEFELEPSRPRRAADDRAVDVGPAGRGKPPSEISAMTRRGEQTVRVSVARLDSLMNLVGELVIDRTRVAQLGADLLNAHGHSDLAIQLKETSAHMARIVSDLQEEVMKARMLPVAQLFRRFPRMVRDLAQKMGKDTELILEGEETELDRSVIEEMADPLTHLLRNAVDHGIEPPEERALRGKPRKARLILAARQEENHIIIEVTDDGAGIDLETLKESAANRGVLSAAAVASLSDEDVLQLVFASGVSTARSLSDVSGRGVGMDVVKTNVSRLHGTVRIHTKLCVGTTVAVRLPLTLAISQALLVVARRGTVAVPLVYVVETTRVSKTACYTIRNRLVTLFRGRVLPLVDLADFVEPCYEASSIGRGEGLVRLVVVRSANQEMGLIVDRLVGEQEIVLKPLGSALGQIPGLSGATILGDGTVALVLDVASLIDHGELEAATRDLASEGSADATLP